MKIHWIRPLLPFVVLATAGLVTAGCQEEKRELAPAATELKAAEAKAPAAVAFAIDKASSKIEFMMEAPQEKIRGRVSGAALGDLQVDPSDVTKTTGLITVDISGLEIFQTVAGKDGKFGTEAKSATQNEHARTWLEISPDTPEDVRAKNGKSQFSIKSVTTAGEKNLSKLTGPERKVTVTASGDFLLHQRQTPKTVDLEVTFHYQGDKPVGVAVKTVKPFGISLAEYDVRPREAFGKLAQKTLDVLAPKVAKDALVALEFSATPGAGATASAKNVEPAK